MHRLAMYQRGVVPFTTGLPSLVHCGKPPVSARTFGMPSLPRSSAARALVCSAGQEQYVTIGRFSAFNSCAWLLRSVSGIEIAPGM